MSPNPFAVLTPPRMGRRLGDQDAGPSSMQRILVWAVVYLALVGYVSLFRQTYVDDAYIAVQYARTLSTDLTWGFYPGHSANTVTSPLNVVALALAGLGFDETVDAVVWLTAAELGLILLVLLRISRQITSGPQFGLIAFVGLAANPLLVSCIGLESHLWILFLLVAVDCYLGGRWRLLGVTLGLLVLTRPDGALLLVVMLALTARRGAGRVLGAALLVVLPWALYSWGWLGSFVPDTLLLKLGQRWEDATFVTGPGLYLERYPAATAATLLFLPFAPLVVPALRTAAPRVRLAIGALVASAVLHYSCYAALGVPPYHWYYTHQVAAIVVCGALGVAWSVRRLQGSPLAYAPAALPLAALAAVLIPTGLHEAPIHTNWASSNDYRAIGERLRDLVEPDAVVDLRGEIGTVAYYSRRLVVDAFADKTRIDAGIAAFVDGLHPRLGWLSRLNFVWRATGEPFAAASYIFDAAVHEELGPPIATWDLSSSWKPHTRVFLYRAASGH